jgi:hypothetical protein
LCPQAQEKRAGGQRFVFLIRDITLGKRFVKRTVNQVANVPKRLDFCYLLWFVVVYGALLGLLTKFF